MRTNLLTFLFIFILLWVISLQGTLSAQSVPVTDLFDATVNGANPNFYFLPPIVAQPQFNGTFDNTLEPTIDICEVVGGLCQFPPVTQFPFGGQGVKLAGNHYKLNWKPSDYNLNPNSFYQIRVLVAGLLMGFVEVSGNLGNQTIPVKFRLEEGCTNWAVVGPEATIVEFENGVVFDIPENALNEYVAITVEDLSMAEVQTILDAKPFRSSEKIFLGGFSAKPDGLTFNEPITAKFSIPHTDKIPVPIGITLEPPMYWVDSTQLVYDMVNDIVEIKMNHFSGEGVAAQQNEDIDCTEGAQVTISIETDFQQHQGGTGCQIIGGTMTVKYLQCNPPYEETKEIYESNDECENLDLQISIAPATADVCRDTQLEPTVTDMNTGDVMDIPLIWSSTNSDAAPIHPFWGIVTGIMPGPVTIQARTADPRFNPGTQIVYVVPCEINVIPNNLTLELEEEFELKARDDEGEPFYCTLRSPDGVTSWIEPLIWESNNPGVVSVNSPPDWKAGIKANSGGTAVIEAYYGAASGTATVTVMESCNNLYAYIDVIYYSDIMFVGDQAQLTATVMVYDTTVWDFVPSDCLGTNFFWISSNEQIATVTQSGLMTGVGVGWGDIRVELVENPSIYGTVGFVINYTLCDKNGDGWLDYNMQAGGAGCCANPPCPWGPEGKCPNPEDPFVTIFNYPYCLCGTCGSGGTSWYGAVCTTGEARVVAECLPHGVLARWGDMVTVRGGDAMVMGDDSTNLYYKYVRKIQRSDEKHVRMIQGSNINLDSLMQDLGCDTIAAWVLTKVENGVVIETIPRPSGGIKSIETKVPTKFALGQNYPNPFNSSTSINYEVPEAKNVAIKVYDVLGKEVSILVDEKKPAGYYEVEFDATILPSGIYFYTIRAGDFVKTKKMVLLR